MSQPRPIGRNRMTIDLDVAGIRPRGRLAILGALSAASLFVAGPALAEYPERDINMIIPFGVSGGSDTLARTIANVIDERDLPPVAILPANRPRASRAVGSRAVATEAGKPSLHPTRKHSVVG